MKNYFYPDRAQNDKIYVFKNGHWTNQLILINGGYYWISLNRCGCNWGEGGYRSLEAAIECAMCEEHPVYQLDTIEELAEFIKETR